MTKTKILIDARLYGTKHTGIGRYVKNLLTHLVKQPEFANYQWSLLVYSEQLDEVKNDLGSNFAYYPTNIRHYSLAEQIFLPGVIYSIKPDLVHFTHFNKPFLYFGRSVVTIHDLIKHFSTGPDTTTRSKSVYWIKYFMYRLLTRLVITFNYIIVPSHYWRDYIIKQFGKNPSKITVTYEATDPGFVSSHKSIKNPENYIIYTGNLYPHKNLQVIIDALKYIPDLKLKIICSRSVFSQRFETIIAQSGLSNQVEMLGFVPDSEFYQLYSKALALVHPSFLEGFSLTGLEAMSLNCPVISSNSSCLPEIYGDSVLYFDPKSPKELADRIKQLQKSKTLRNDLINKGIIQLKKYSWQKTASQTLKVYQTALNA